MSSFYPSWSSHLFLVVTILIVSGKSTIATYYGPSQWTSANATFYGDETASETMGGACGYGNLFQNGYGTNTAALSTTLFNDGFGCGTCYQIKCTDAKGCNSNVPFITITATNICPPNWSQDSNNGGWCNPPRVHFDMAKPAFMQIADWKVGFIPVEYRRVTCQVSGGVKFSFQGNSYWLLVYVMNVGGGGDIASMSVRGTKTDNWIPMSHNWGASYQAFSALGGQALSFKLTSYTSKETIILQNVAPSSWTTGVSYTSQLNFQ
ncbi:hypothetical protein ACFE04_015321 [Oxalis oulophora]